MLVVVRNARDITVDAIEETNYVCTFPLVAYNQQAGITQKGEPAIHCSPKQDIEVILTTRNIQIGGNIAKLLREFRASYPKTINSDFYDLSSHTNK